MREAHEAERAVRPGPGGDDVLADLRRPSGRTRPRHVSRQEGERALQPEERLRDRALEAHIVPLHVIDEGSDEEFVDRAWQSLLRRAPETEAREAALAKLRQGTISRASLLRQITTSD